MKISSMFKKLSKIVLTLALVGGIINTYGKAGEVKAETVDYSLYIDVDEEKIYKNNSSSEELTESLKENLYFDKGNLVFNNFEFTSSTIKAVEVKSNNKFTIELIGTSEITNTPHLVNFSGGGAAFYTESSAVIKGTGSLTVSNEITFEQSEIFNQENPTYAMFFYGLTMESGSVIVTTNDSPYNGYALYCYENLNLNSNDAYLEAVADINTENEYLTNGYQNSTGIYAKNIYNKGTIYAQGLSAFEGMSVINSSYLAVFESVSNVQTYRKDGDEEEIKNLKISTSTHTWLEKGFVGGEGPDDEYELTCNQYGCSYADGREGKPTYVRYQSKKIPLTSVEFRETEDILLELAGEEKYLTLSGTPYYPTVNDDVAGDYEITSSDESVATIVDNQYVKAVGNGRATLTITTIYPGVSDEIDVVVNIIEGVTTDYYMFLPEAMGDAYPAGIYGVVNDELALVEVDGMEFANSKLNLNNFEMFTANDSGALNLFGATTINITGTNQIKVLESKVDEPAIYTNNPANSITIEGNGSLFVNGFIGTLNLGENVNFESYSENLSYMGLEIVLSANDTRTIRGGEKLGETKELVYDAENGYYVLKEDPDIIANYIVIGEPTVTPEPEEPDVETATVTFDVANLPEVLGYSLGGGEPNNVTDELKIEVPVGTNLTLLSKANYKVTVVSDSGSIQGTVTLNGAYYISELGAIQGDVTIKVGEAVETATVTFDVANLPEVLGYSLGGGEPNNVTDELKIEVPVGTNLTLLSKANYKVTVVSDSGSIQGTVTLNGAYYISELGAIQGDVTITVGNATNPGGSTHNHNALEFEPITTSDEFMDAVESGGNYYLANDIVLDDVPLSIYDSFNLCLNGHKLDMSSYTGAISIENGYTGIYDCNGANKTYEFGVDENTGMWVLDGDGSVKKTVTGGVITGSKSGVFSIYAGTLELSGGNLVGNSSTRGGAVYLQRGNFIMNGGAIKGNIAELTQYGDYGQGSAVYNFLGKFVMAGGIITENTANAEMGGAVYVAPGTPATLEFSGYTIVTNNKDAEGNKNNVMLDYSEASYGSIEIDEAIENATPLSVLINIGYDGLMGNAKIGVSTNLEPTEESNVIFANNPWEDTTDYSKYFSSDSGYSIVFDATNNQLQLSATKAVTYPIDGKVENLGDDSITIDGKTVKFDIPEDTGDYIYYTEVLPVEYLGGMTVDEYIGMLVAGKTKPVLDVPNTVDLSSVDSNRMLAKEGTLFVTNGNINNMTVEPTQEVEMKSVAVLYKFHKDNMVSKEYEDAASNPYFPNLDKYTYAYAVYGVHAEVVTPTGSGSGGNEPGQTPGDDSEEDDKPIYVPIIPETPKQPTTAVEKLDTTTTNVETIIATGKVEEVNKVVEATLATDYLNVEINDNGVQYSATEAEKYDVRIDNLNTVVTALLTNDEIVQAASGKLNASILLETEVVVLENVPETTKTKIADTTPVGYQVRETVDISLFKVLGSEKTQIKETSAGIEVTMELPESIRNEKNVKIIRVHNEGTPEEEAVVLTSVVNGDGTITFITDKFSTYAFVTSDMDLSAYSNFGLEVYHNSRVISLENTKNGFDVFGYMWIDYVTPTKNTWREIIFVNTEDPSTDKAYRMNANAVYNTFLNTNMYATRDGKVDLSYACYKANVNTNSISSYDKKSTGKMASGTYYAFMRISDGKDSYLFPLVDRVLSDGSTLTLPADFSLSDDLARTLIYTVK